MSDPDPAIIGICCAKWQHYVRPHSNHLLQNTYTQKNNMANQLPTREFVYTGEGVIPHDVTHVEFAPSVIGFVGSVAFRDCRNSLRMVVLNEGLQIIGSDTFSGCSSLESLAIPSTAISICSYAFVNCSSLKEVVLNVGLKTIESYACSYC